jgi:hypothetical protein
MVGFTGKLASHLIIRKCPYCHSNDVRRSHRKNLVEVAVSFAGIFPFAARVVTVGSERQTADWLPSFRSSLNWSGRTVKESLFYFFNHPLSRTAREKKAAIKKN